MLKLYKDSNEFDKRINIITKRNKWNVFRDERKKVIDSYLKVKKK